MITKQDFVKKMLSDLLEVVYLFLRGHLFLINFWPLVLIFHAGMVNFLFRTKSWPPIMKRRGKKSVRSGPVPFPA